MTRQPKLRGFSLIESLLSIFVMSVGLMTIVAVISGSLRSSYDTQDTIIAAELAQEGVELVRNIRDNNFVAGVAGDEGFNGFKNSEKHCRIDWRATLDCQSSQGNNSRYTLQYVGGAYGHTGTGETRFARYIYIDHSGNGADQQAVVKSFVSWGGFDISRINSGDPDLCNDSATCVYTESFLTAWYTP